MRGVSASGALLYVSDESTNDVYVYSAQGVLTGTLTGFDTPQGECTDARQNVYVTNFGNGETIVYAHGGTTPLATLNDPGEYIEGCAVDPQTGKLAVANFRDTQSGPGSVSVYTSRGLPTVYSNPNVLISVLALGYDNSGNLFIDGFNPSGNFALAELPKGGANFESINVTQAISYPGGVRFDGKYLAVGDAQGSVVYQFQVTGQTATVVGTTPLSGANNTFQFCFVGSSRQGVQASSIVGANTFSPADVLLWNYPAGGTPTKTLSGFSQPIGVAFSL